MDLVNKQLIYNKIVKRYPDRDTDQYAVGYADAINDVLRDIRYEPSAEPEIIHCKDCIHWKHSEFVPNYCEVWDWCNTGDDYCSSAERKNIDGD